MDGYLPVLHTFSVPYLMTTESKLKGRQKMNIKISKKRAAQILAEEIEAFIEQNKDLDSDILKERIRAHFSIKETTK